MINVGTNSISNMMIGSTQVNKTYVGTTLVWEYQTGGLPSGYTEVDYISSTAFGEQYIDLDILLYDTLNKDYDIAIKFNAIGSGQLATTSDLKQATIFNCQQNVKPYPGTFIRVNSKNTKEITGRYIGGTAKDNTLGTIATDIELTEKTPPAKNVTDYNNSDMIHNWGTSLFCIFNSKDKTARLRYIEAKLYYFKLFVEGTLVRDMVPCINPNNVVGLYDLVNRRFYSSPNGAAFITNNESYYGGKYLTFQALQNGTFSFSNDISYSIDNGQTWTTLTAGTQSPTITTGNTILWKGNLTATSADGIGTFSSTGKFTAYGNVMSLIYGDNFEGNNTITMTSCFRNLFYNGNVVYAHNLILPATTLTGDCYCQMFYNCTSLITAPKLPAIRLVTECYYGMFFGCTSLTTAPKLPSRQLAINCYEYMFKNCKSLTTAPELPATTLTNGCYDSMFEGCTSLSAAPALPATTLVRFCYTQMFYNCSNLNYIKMLATDISASFCLSSWVYGVASTGTFVKNANATWTDTGTSGVPTNWTVITQ